MNKRKIMLIAFCGILLVGFVSVFLIIRMINDNTEGTENISTEPSTEESMEIIEYPYENLDENTYIIVNDKFGTTIHTPECKIGLRTPYKNKGSIGGGSLEVILKNNPSYKRCSECLGE